jgi:hypothetical protein
LQVGRALIVQVRVDHLLTVTLALAAGCAGNAAPARDARATGDTLAAVSASAPPPLTATAAAPSAAPPPPGVPVTLDDLPALSVDGRTVAGVLHDGFYSEPWTSALVLVDVDSDRVRERVVLSIHDDETEEKTSARQHAAAARLDATRWLRPERIEVSDDPTVGARVGGVGGEAHARIGHAGDMTIRFDEPRFTVRREGSSVPEVDIDARGWSKRGHRGKEMEPCGWLAQMDGLWYVATEGLLVVDVGYYGGSDTCGEPANALHVVRLQRAPEASVRSMNAR